MCSFIEQAAFAELKLHQGCQSCSSPQHALESITWLQLQATPAQLQAAKVQAWWQLAKIKCTKLVTQELNAIDMMTVLAQVRQHTICLLLMGAVG
jgi:hypothetical protein